MLERLLRRTWFVSLFALAACSSSTTDVAPGDDTGTGAETATDTGGQTAGFKTYVVLGDSISDGGGQAPFFYDLLYADLQAKYPGIVEEKHSKAGAVASGLLSQAQALPTSLQGPVLITITIGGNDVTGAMGAILQGGTDTAARTKFTTTLDQALAELTKTDRFGAGVQATVLLANIYDPSDGTGNFTYQGASCGIPFSLWNKGSTDSILTPWEQAMTDTAAKYPQVKVLDLHTRFHGHGVAANPTWFVKDCIHPNALGHADIRSMFLDGVNSL